MQKLIIIFYGLGTNVGCIVQISGGLRKHLNLFSRRHRHRLVLGLDSLYLRKTERARSFRILYFGIWYCALQVKATW